MADLTQDQLEAPSEDNQILALWSAGRRDESLRWLLEAHGGRVRAALRRRFPAVRDEHTLLEAINDAARSVFKAFDSSKGCSLGGWFLFIAGRRLCDLVRGERLRLERNSPLDRGLAADEHGSPENVLINQEFRQAVNRAMSQLSELERAVIEADIDAGKQARAGGLARRLKTTEQSIYAARARARKKLLESPWMKPLYRRTG